MIKGDQLKSLNRFNGLNDFDALHQLLNDPSTHTVLVERITADEHKDPVDNIHNARLLLFMHELRLATLPALHSRTRIGVLQ